MAHPERRAAQAGLGDHRQGVHDGALEREDQHHRPLENEAFKAEAHHRDPGRQPAGPVPVVGRRRAQAAGRRRSGQGHHRRRLVLGRQPVADRAASRTQIDGKHLRHPVGLGMVGFWYNKDLFTKAGITAPPTTWAELLDAVGKLKTAGITPIALGRQGQVAGPLLLVLPGHAHRRRRTRSRQADAGQQLRQARTSSRPVREFKELVDLQPFQNGFLGAGYGSPDGQAAAMGNGQAAMELMGQWAPAVQAASSTSTKGIGDKLGFFPFPSVDGGKGKATDVFGGGNGFAVGKDAPPATRRLPEVLPRRGAAAPGHRDRRDPADRQGRRGRHHGPQRQGRGARRSTRPPASSSTSTRRTRRPSARRSTTASPSSSPARRRPSRSPRTSPRAAKN